jgi:arylsulfatase A-like enzyme/Flp pilus assembly protein TadD
MGVASVIGRRDLREIGEGASIRGAFRTSTLLRCSVRPTFDRRAAAQLSAVRSFGVHLGVLCGIALGALGGCGAPASPAPKRVVLVTIDTLRADHVGCYGALGAHTPQLDTIAALGVRFEVALSPVPLTLPAHASLMTGLDPPGHGVRHNSVHRLGPEPETLAERLRGAGYATAAFVGARVLDRRFGLGRGFDVYDDRSSGRVSAATGFAERPADAVVDAALGWLRGAPERFFLWVHFFDPHADYRPPPGFASAFANDLYSGEIAFVDAELGRLLGAIEARWGVEDLAVVATADHGESRGEHGELTHAYSLYDATQRVPLVLRGPGLPRGRVAPGPASLLDVAPTLLAWVGVPPLPEAEGRDLRLLAEQSELGPRALYLETLATQLDFGWSPLQAVWVERLKYVRAPRPELYDLESDPGETLNRASSEAGRVAELDGRLDALLAGRHRVPRPAHLGEAERDALRALGYVVPEGEMAPEDLGRVGGEDPKDHVGALRELALVQVALAQDRPQEALQRLDRLPYQTGQIVVHRAAAALAAGDPVRAEREARAVLVAEPGRSDARLLLARSLSEQGRQGEADRALAELPPELVPAAWVALRAARAELAEGRGEAALRRLALARERFPDDPSLARGHGDLLEAGGRLEEALAAREAALVLAPADAGACNDVAWTLAALQRDLDRALVLARRAVEGDGEEPAFLDTLATVLLARGDAHAALTLVERALPSARGSTREHLLALRASAQAQLGSGTPGEG